MINATIEYFRKINYQLGNAKATTIDLEIGYAVNISPLSQVISKTSNHIDAASQKEIENYLRNRSNKFARDFEGNTMPVKRSSVNIRGSLLNSDEDITAAYITSRRTEKKQHRRGLNLKKQL